MAKLIIRRKSSIQYIFRRKFSIFLDNKKIECDITEGKHTLIIESRTNRIKQGIIVEKNTESVEIVLSALRAFTTIMPQVREINYK